MRTLICGGRECSLDTVWKWLEENGQDITTVIHGGARGADTMAGRWAKFNLIPVIVFPARWAEFGKPAGFIRNQQMLDEGDPENFIAFPGGKGTADMVKRAEKYNKDRAKAGLSEMSMTVLLSEFILQPPS